MPWAGVMVPPGRAGGAGVLPVRRDAAAGGSGGPGRGPVVGSSPVGTLRAGGRASAELLPGAGWLPRQAGRCALLQHPQR